MTIESVRTWDEVSPYFSPAEIFSPDTLNNQATWGIIDTAALRKLNAFRDALQTPIHCNHGALHLRGVRSPGEQMRVVKQYGGALVSQHCAGRAFDLTCPAMSLPQFAAVCERFGWHGIGIYHSKNFVHVDLRTLFSAKQIIWSA